jgi:hypothetical protein
MENRQDLLNDKRQTELERERILTNKIENKPNKRI